MTFTQLIASMKAILDGTGLHTTPDERVSSLSEAGRGKFDGSYLLRLVEGPSPYPEISLDPDTWVGRVRLEIGTEVVNSIDEEQITFALRGRMAINQLVYQDAGRRFLYDWNTPVISRVAEDKRLVWSVTFSARWNEV